MISYYLLISLRLGQHLECHAVKQLGPVENPTVRSIHLPLHLRVPRQRIE